MRLTYYFEVISDACATIDIDEDELEKPWDEMTNDEKARVALAHEDDAYHKASDDSDYSLGDLTFVEDEDGEEMCRD